MTNEKKTNIKMFEYIEGSFAEFDLLTEDAKKFLNSDGYKLDAVLSKIKNCAPVGGKPIFGYLLEDDDISIHVGSDFDRKVVTIKMHHLHSSIELKYRNDILCEIYGSFGFRHKRRWPDVDSISVSKDGEITIDNNSKNAIHEAVYSINEFRPLFYDFFKKNNIKIKSRKEDKGEYKPIRINFYKKTEEPGCFTMTIRRTYISESVLQRTLKIDDNEYSMSINTIKIYKNGEIKVDLEKL